MDAARARALLEDEARRLAAVAQHRHDRPELGGSGEAERDPDPTAAGADLLDREIEAAVDQAVRHDLQEVADALGRLDAGTYGRCAACGEPLPDERLEALPAARYCCGHELEAEIRLGATSDTVGAEDAESVRREAQQHLSFLPDDDGPDDQVAVGAEDAAVHLDPQS